MSLIVIRRANHCAGPGFSNTDSSVHIMDIRRGRKPVAIVCELFVIWHGSKSERDVIEISECI